MSNPNHDRQNYSLGRISAKQTTPKEYAKIKLLPDVNVKTLKRLGSIIEAYDIDIDIEVYDADEISELKEAIILSLDITPAKKTKVVKAKAKAKDVKKTKVVKAKAKAEDTTSLGIKGLVKSIERQAKKDGFKITLPTLTKLGNLHINSKKELSLNLIIKKLRVALPDNILIHVYSTRYVIFYNGNKLVSVFDGTLDI